MPPVLSFEIRLALPCGPERAFDHTVDIRHMPSFTGYGPVPGIASVEAHGPPGVGERRAVLNTDGSRHVETFTVYDRPSRHTARIEGLGPPFAWLVREIADDWRFERDGEATRVSRRFRFWLTGWAAYPAARLLLIPFKQAVKRHMEAVQQACGAISPRP